MAEQPESKQYSVTKKHFTEFSPDLLGLGALGGTRKSIEALVAVFDLKDFTVFCDQRDPHLEVPKFITSFLNWLFKGLAKEAKQHTKSQRVVLWHPLPFFAKFRGDGVLFIWEADAMTDDARANLVTSLQILCNDYHTYLFSKVKKSFSKPPSQLRCGVAVGQIVPIGNGRDFSGLCINIATRLQKLGEGEFSFAFTKKGLDNKE